MTGKWNRTAAVSITLAALVAGCVPAGFSSGSFRRTGDEAPLRLVLSPVGTLSVIDESGTEVDSASFQVSENEIAIESESTCPNTAGVYTWAFDGQTLKLTAISDDCLLRKTELTTFDWVKE
jgi:hypothetical protein